MIESCRRRPRRGFTLVELLVVIAIIGVLVGLLLPAVQSAREAARRLQCRNHLKQLALAGHLHHDVYNYLPPARYEPRPGSPAEESCGGREATWFVRILPFIEQQTAYSVWDLSRPWFDHPHEVREASSEVFFCPSRRGISQGLTASTTGEVIDRRLPCGCPWPSSEDEGASAVSGSLGDYAGNHGDLTPGATGAATDFYYGGNGTGTIISVRAQCRDGRPLRPLDRVRFASISDGLSQTLLVGEKHVPIERLEQFPEDTPIYDGDHLPAASRLAGPGVRLAQGPRDEIADALSFGSWHPGVCQFAMADGSVRSISVTIDTRTLGLMANRADNRVIELGAP